MYRHYFVAVVLGVALSGCASSAPQLLDRLPSEDDKGRVQAVIEIPAGTLAKFEIDKVSGALVQDIQDGAPRFIRFLPYPSNYGMIPSTLLPTADGGDGDPLDVLVLGSTIPRGAVVSIRLLGVLELLDGGEADDKLIAVPLIEGPGNPFARYDDLAQLRAAQPQALEIIATWFTAYKGHGVMTLKGWGDRERARATLKAAQRAFQRGPLQR